MRKPRLFLFTLCALFTFNMQGQTTVYSCNGKYCIELPDILELQVSELNNIQCVNIPGKKPQTKIETQSGHIIFQQKGLNDDVQSAYNNYCRVIVEYFKEDRNDPTFATGDNIVIDKDVLYAVNETARQNCEISGTPLIKLISVEGITINGFPVLYYSYKRKGWEGKKPPVIVNVFRIFNRYESITLTFSYRESERETWKGIHSNIIKTFKFTRKY